MTSCAIIVTHNSEKHIAKAVQCLEQQTVPFQQVIIVDSGSRDIDYLKHFRAEVVNAGSNVGFCRANNLGMRHVRGACDYVLFLNPDAFLFPTFHEEALRHMEAKPGCGVLTGPLFGYDIEKDEPTGKYDSTGIFRAWYGRWYDREQGTAIHEQEYPVTEDVPAICGACMFCRKGALEEVMIGDHEVFDSSFYMYKEDIDLSLRLREKGWGLCYIPKAKAYHCRGWNRRGVPRKMRLFSAWNELRLHTRMQSVVGTFYSSLKYFLVKFCNR